MGGVGEPCPGRQLSSPLPTVGESESQALQVPGVQRRDTVILSLGYVEWPGSFKILIACAVPHGINRPSHQYVLMPGPDSRASHG